MTPEEVWRKENNSLSSECWEKEVVFDPGLIFFLTVALSQRVEVEFACV